MGFVIGKAGVEYRITDSVFFQDGLVELRAGSMGDEGRISTDHEAAYKLIGLQQFPQ
jgi:hypothetical protein